MDQGIEVPNLETGKSSYMFGGDFGPANVISDGAFCLNGVLRADQDPQPHAWEIQHVRQFVKATLMDSASLTVAVRNRFSFTTLTNLRVLFAVQADGHVVENEERIVAELA